MALVNKEHLALCFRAQFTQLVGMIHFVTEYAHPRHPHLHDMRVIFMEKLAGLLACPSWRWRPACRSRLL